MNLLNQRIIKQRGVIESLKKENRKHLTIICDDRYGGLDSTMTVNKSIFKKTQQTTATLNTNLNTLNKAAATVFDGRSNSYQIPRKRAQSAIQKNRFGK